LIYVRLANAGGCGILKSTGSKLHKAADNQRHVAAENIPGSRSKFDKLPECKVDFKYPIVQSIAG